VIGSANVDFTVALSRLPRPGETVSGGTLLVNHGGKGANQAVAARRLGAEVRMIGCIGADSSGAQIHARLAEQGIGVEGLMSVSEAATGTALIAVDAEGRNQISVAPGANHRLTVEMAQAHEAVIAWAEVLLCQLEIPVEAIEAAVPQAPYFCLNAAPAVPLPAELVRAADLVVVNRYELDALPEAPHLTALTLGAEGAVLLEDGEEVARAAPPRVDAVDGTAAGDAFTACMVVSLLEGRDREEALLRSCAAGAIAASRLGAQPSLPTAAEIDDILRR